MTEKKSKKTTKDALAVEHESASQGSARDNKVIVRKRVIIVFLTVLVLSVVTYGAFWFTVRDKDTEREEYEVSDIQQLRLDGTNEEVYRAADSLLDDEKISSVDRAGILTSLGDVYRSDDRPRDAKEAYEEAISLLGSEATNVQYARLAAVYEELDEYSLAIKYYQKALDNFDEANDPFADEEKGRIKGNIALLEEMKDE